MQTCIRDTLVAPELQVLNFKIQPQLVIMMVSCVLKSAAVMTRLCVITYVMTSVPSLQVRRPQQHQQTVRELDLQGTHCLQLKATVLYALGLPEKARCCFLKRLRH